MESARNAIKILVLLTLSLVLLVTKQLIVQTIIFVSTCGVSEKVIKFRVFTQIIVNRKSIKSGQ